MREFVFTSKRFEGSMRFVYENDKLFQFECKAKLDDIQLDFFEQRFPFRLESLQRIAGSGNISEITNLSFDIFWEKYNYKMDKVNAIKYWDKMPKEDKVAAITGIYKYHNQCINNKVAKVYPERYLKYKRYLDETE